MPSVCHSHASCFADRGAGGAAAAAGAAAGGGLKLLRLLQHNVTPAECRGFLPCLSALTWTSVTGALFGCQFL